MLCEPMVVCRYGWGEYIRLYLEHLEINGIPYALSELVDVKSKYRSFLGFAFMRLDLQFQERAIVLRGIVEIEAAQKIVAYLMSWCFIAANVDKTPSTECIPVLAKEPAERVATASNDVAQNLFWEYIPVESEQDRAVQSVIAEVQRQYQERQVLRTLRLKRLQSERAMREHGFDVEKLALFLQDEVLPIIDVPIRLLPDEVAYYCTEAMLCEEPFNGSARYKYRVEDQGALILTNKRTIYLGLKRQLVLKHTHLIHFARLHGVFAVLATYWTRRQLFQVSRPLECTMYLECILQKYHQVTSTMYAQLQPEPLANPHGTSETLKEPLMHNQRNPLSPYVHFSEEVSKATM